MNEIWFSSGGGVGVRKLSGSKMAFQVLHCNHVIETGMTMRQFRISKGEMTVCPNGCGLQKTIRVESEKGI